MRRTTSNISHPLVREHRPVMAHRAFNEHAVRDARVVLVVLEKIHGGPLPTDPVEQNRTWYRMYKSVENDPQDHPVDGDRKRPDQACFLFQKRGKAADLSRLRRSD